MNPPSSIVAPVLPNSTPSGSALRNTATRTRISPRTRNIAIPVAPAVSPDARVVNQPPATASSSAVAADPSPFVKDSPSRTIVVEQPATRTVVVEEPVEKEGLVDAKTETKLCYRSKVKGADQTPFSVDEILLSRQFNILNVYVDEEKVPRLIKVEDFLGNISFIAFDLTGTICVKNEVVKTIKKIDSDDLSSSLKNGSIQTTLTEGVVIQKGTVMAVLLKGCRLKAECQSWVFTDGTINNGIYPLVTLETLYKVGTEVVRTINESVKNLDRVALLRAAENVKYFCMSLDNLLSWKCFANIIVTNGNYLINTDFITTELAKIRKVSSEEYPEKVGTISVLLQQKRLRRQLFNQLMNISADISKINHQFCEMGETLREIHRVLSVQTDRLTKGI